MEQGALQTTLPRFPQRLPPPAQVPPAVFAPSLAPLPLLFTMPPSTRKKPRRSWKQDAASAFLIVPVVRCISMSAFLPCPEPRFRLGGHILCQFKKTWQKLFLTTSLVFFKSTELRYQSHRCRSEFRTNLVSLFNLTFPSKILKTLIRHVFIECLIYSRSVSR